jgi:LmbE family N-acetylglucosaminyl deacetylase
MRLDFSNDRLLAVVAHPDDAELLCAGTLARARADGAAIGICVLCRGDKGQPNRPIRNLAAVRRAEMQASAKLLGARLFWTGFADSELTDSQLQRRKLIGVYRQFKPTLVLAHAPQDYHPDHQVASKLAEAASWFCASRGLKTHSAALDTSPAVWWMDTITMSGFEPGFFVDVSDHLALKLRLLACHRSQLERGKDSNFSPLEDLMHLQARARGSQAGVAAAEAFRACQTFKRARAW